MSRTTETRDRLEKLLEGTIGRENFEELIKAVYDSFNTVDLAESRVSLLLEKSEAAGAQNKDLQEQTGILLFALGRHGEAVEALSPVKSRKTAAYFLGRAYLSLDRPQEALPHLENARSADGDFDAEMHIADAMCRSGDCDGAAKLCKPYRKSHAEDPAHQFALGRIAECNGEYAEAMDRYERAIELDAGHCPSLFRLAYNCDLNGDDERAIELYERCAAQKPAPLGAVMNLGVLYEDHERYYEAIECYRRVLAMDPVHQKARLFLRDAESSLTMHVDDIKSWQKRHRQDVLNIPVENFELSVRSRSCLDRLDIKKLGDLVRVGKEDLLGAKNFGETSLEEIERLLNENGLSLGEALEGDTDRLQAVQDAIATVFGADEEEDETLSMPVEVLNLATRSRGCIEHLKVGTVGDLIRHTEEDLLGSPNFGRKSLGEVKQKLAALGLKLKSE